MPAEQPRAPEDPRAPDESRAADQRAPDESRASAAPHEAVQLPGRYDAPLFADERARLDTVARDQLGKQTSASITLVAQAELDALKKLAASGRVRAGGPRCAKPPTYERAVRLHHPDAWGAQAETVCMGAQCTIWLYVREPTRPADWDNTLEWPVKAEASENVDAVTDVAAFEAAIRSIGFSPPAPETGVLGGLGMGRGFGFGSGGPPHRHQIIDVEPAGPWAQQPTSKDLAHEQAAFDACPATKSLDDEILIDVNARGAVDRCETGAPACLCTAIRAHTFASGPPLRRARVRFAATGAASGFGSFGRLGGRKGPSVFIRGYGSEFDADSEVMHASEKALGACFTATAPAGKFDATVAMTVDEAGHVKDARVTDGHDSMTEPELACVAKWARSLSFSCETLDGSTATVDALLSVRR